MKSRETLIRLKKFQVDEKRRRVAQIEGMIAEFDRISGDLDREIKTEQDRAGIHDPGHFAYPTYAKAAMQRRENLQRSVSELRAQLDDAQAALGEAFEELKKVELLDERDQMRERAEEAAREQAELDAIGMPQRRPRLSSAYLPDFARLVSGCAIAALDNHGALSTAAGGRR
jgi:flagellar export protein FliJ